MNEETVIKETIAAMRELELKTFIAGDVPAEQTLAPAPAPAKSERPKGPSGAERKRQNWTRIFRGIERPAQNGRVPRGRQGVRSAR